MNWEQNKFHKEFKLNGFSFSSVDEILAYTKDFSNEIYQFLKDWFSSEEFILVQTSGSTGIPKKIKLQKKQMINSAEATGSFFDIKEKTTALLCLSVNYIAGKMMLVRALTLGWHLDVVAATSFPLEETNKKYDFSAMVPLQLENSINHLYKVKKLIVGGGVVSALLRKKIQKSSCVIYATYGMTETITHIAIKQLNQITIYPNFYKVLQNVTIYKDVRNCLVIRAPKVSNEVVFTNDIVRLVSDTEFEWLGRFDNVINSGGIKLHPEKIEEKISRVIENRFFVIGVSDKKLGEKLILIVEGVHQSIDLKSAELSKFEVPKEIYFIDKFIETETKKIQRKKTLDLISIL
ncbi:AMP-binding protein [Polaribacter sargassicola]|uniref:AMP-binding protein n=1 Tax=Polaribacter sargassicola TaxID=2836891 RepID=UPI001F297ADE|nr:AMP-binding protein [Polaribacter sp. DS7-9]MCG1035441.1 AMP-binding protein [Polaribacter sp. DS7-9]